MQTHEEREVSGLLGCAVLLLADWHEHFEASLWSCIVGVKSACPYSFFMDILTLENEAIMLF